MTELELLNRALYYSATIQQPHAIKAYLAAKNIHACIQKDGIWKQTDQLIALSEIYNTQLFAQHIQAPEFSKKRIEGILKRGIYPVAYSALLQWHLHLGFADIVNHYLEKAALNNEYLSHNVTILLSFSEIYPQLDAQQVYPFLDRVTEFLTTTFGHDDHLKKIEISERKTCLISNEALLQKCLIQPSFFGHNLITLTWLMRFESKLPPELMAQFKMNLHFQATAPLEDPEDEMDEMVFQESIEGNENQFMKNLNELIFGVSKNLHQVTLADALLFLQQQFPEYTQQLCRIADYQVRILKKGLL